MKLANYLIRKKIRTLLSRPDGRKPAFRPFAEIKDVLLFCHVKDLEALQPCIGRLRRMHKKVSAGIYLPAGIRPPEAGPHAIFLNGEKGLKGWLPPSSAIMKRFNAVRADLLIDLTPPECLPMRYMLLQHPCRFKVGVKQEGHEPDFYDLSILSAKREGFTQIFEHILFYLQAIRTE